MDDLIRPDNNGPEYVQIPVKKLTGWASFVAIMDIIYGAFVCLTIIGAAFGVFRILAGVKLMNACNALESYQNTKDPAQIAEAMDLLNKRFKFRGISFIIVIALSIIGIIFYIWFIVYIFSNFPNIMNEQYNF